jgi:hypothetical protein
MSTADRPEAGPADDVAASLRDAGFVRLVAAQTGDAVAATGLLAGALDTVGVPYQTSVVALPNGADRATDADCTVALGRPAATGATLGTGTKTASAAAFAVVRELGSSEPGSSEPGSTSTVLALAGTLAAGQYPGDELLAAAEDTLDRRPGVAVPTADRADGLAHSTLVHAPFSGSVERVRELVADRDPRERASLVALAVAGDEHGVSRGATSVERVLRPFVGGPFETAGGYGDVLDAVARERPGMAVALALGADLDAAPVWREHAVQAHAGVRAARTGRYDGLFVARCEDQPPVGTVARLVHDYRSPEPVTLAVADGIAVAVATAEAADARTVLGEATTAVGGTAAGTQTRARGTFDGDANELVLAAREAV